MKFSLETYLNLKMNPVKAVKTKKHLVKDVKSMPKEAQLQLTNSMPHRRISKKTQTKKALSPKTLNKNSSKKNCLSQLKYSLFDRNKNSQRLRKTNRKKLKRNGSPKKKLKYKQILADKPCQVYARVTRILGQGYLEAVCYEEKDQFVVHCKRLCHIRGKMRKREWIKTNDIVLVSLREFELNKADVIHVYQKREATYLRINGEIPQVDGAIEMEEFSQKQQNNFKVYHLQDFLKEGHTPC
jgi:translation initiation factor 1A